MSANSNASPTSVLRLGVLLLLGLLSSACTSTTVLQADFTPDTVGSSPSSNQTVGTVSITPGTVVVVAAPAPDLPNTKWARFTQPSNPGLQASLVGHLSGSQGAGDYTLTATLFIPKGSGAVSVSFEAFISDTTSPRFMHLDFMPEDNVRVDDDESKRFGHFPRDKPFGVTVHLIITATDAKATISLFGADTSGSFDNTVDSHFLGAARQFNAVRFFMGFPFQGVFFAENIVVTRKS